jgi:hypothetical protein
MSAAALLSPPFTLYKVGYWKYPINQQEECFGSSIVLHMYRISLVFRSGGRGTNLTPRDDQLGTGAKLGRWATVCP